MIAVFFLKTEAAILHKYVLIIIIIIIIIITVLEKTEQLSHYKDDQAFILRPTNA